jgi:hypothetical protein
MSMWDSLMAAEEGWRKPPIATEETKTLTVGEGGKLPLPRMTIGAPFDIEIITPGTAEIKMGYIVSDQPKGTQVTVEYWAIGDAKGYFPGNLPPEETLQSKGPFLYKDYSPGPGGYLKFEANNEHSHFMTTPVLGEIDWIAKWQGTRPLTPDDPPRSDYWQIGLSDLVLLANAYGTRGTGGIPFRMPGSGGTWNPAADVENPAGIVGLSDLVALAINYGKISMKPGLN